jgi:hypothetical protein
MENGLTTVRREDFENAIRAQELWLESFPWTWLQGTSAQMQEGVPAEPAARSTIAEWIVTGYVRAGELRSEDERGWQDLQDAPDDHDGLAEFLAGLYARDGYPVATEVPCAGGRFDLCVYARDKPGQIIKVIEVGSSRKWSKLLLAFAAERVLEFEYLFTKRRSLRFWVSDARLHEHMQAHLEAEGAEFDRGHLP